MLSLKRIVESYGMSGQYYDLGRDFSSFRRMVDGSTQNIRAQYEKAISAHLVGKRVRARASRGYKQYVKDYEFDIVKITIDDYYDNYVVVAHDSTTPKPKEYFLKTGFKIQILGPATGQPSPQKGGAPKKPEESPSPISSEVPSSSPEDTSQQHVMSLAPAGATNPAQPLKEEPEKPEVRCAYSIERIITDIQEWLPKILNKPQTSMRDFIREVGWEKNLMHKVGWGENSNKGITVILYEIIIPFESIKPGIKLSMVEQLISKQSRSENGKQLKFSLVTAKQEEEKDVWKLRIKKTIS